MASPQNKHIRKGIEPLSRPKAAHINIIGQAPGLKTQARYLLERIQVVIAREWLGVDRTTFTILVVWVIPWTFVPRHLRKLVTFHLARLSEVWHPQLLKVSRY